jgi:hypothetical protein
MEKILKLCEGMGLKSCGNNRGLLWGLAALVLLSGCSGVLMEKYNSEGQMDRIKIDALDWRNVDAKPRSPHDARGLDDISIMLKSEKTF